METIMSVIKLSCLPPTSATYSWIVPTGILYEKPCLLFACFTMDYGYFLLIYVAFAVADGKYMHEYYLPQELHICVNDRVNIGSDNGTSAGTLMGKFFILYTDISG